MYLYIKLPCTFKFLTKLENLPQKSSKTSCLLTLRFRLSILCRFVLPQGSFISSLLFLLLAFLWNAEHQIMIPSCGREMPYSNPFSEVDLWPSCGECTHEVCLSSPHREDLPQLQRITCPEVIS